MAAALLLTGSGSASAQGFTYRGFAEGTVTVYPQTVPNDSTRVVGEGLFRIDPSWQISREWTVAGTFEARADTHAQTARSAEVTYWDRGIRRPALAVRRATVTYARGPLTLELGKQFIRWGQTDILNPTDRFTPRDYMIVVASEVLATTGARLTVGTGGNSLGAVWAPRLTPSRLPLFAQRWAGLDAAGSQVTDAGSLFPRGSQYGIRWSHVGRRVEFSLSGFRGFNHLPLLEVAPSGGADGFVVRRRYPAIRAWGADAVVPLPWVAIKAEAAFVEAPNRDADEYLLYVVQAERQYRDWLFIGGYVGEWVSVRRQIFAFAPDRGLARSIILRAGYMMDASRALTLETLVRQDGRGFYGKAEYSRGAGQHWRVAVRLLVIAGSDEDFLGQYRRNSYGGSSVRFSF